MRAPGASLASAALACAALIASGCRVAPPPALGLRLAAPASPLIRYRLIEFDLQAPVPAANPFDPGQIDLRVTFTPAAGQPLTVPAFIHQAYDARGRQPAGALAWKARFTPPAAGRWTAQARLTAGVTRLDSPVLALEVAEAGAGDRGFIRPHPANPRYLAFENGETFFPIGLNLAWWNGDPLDDYRRWFDALQRNGANTARIWMASWSFGLEWDDTGLGDYTRRLDRAWLLDQVMRMAEERGIYVILVLLNHGAFNITINPEWHRNPYNQALGGPCARPADFASDPAARDLFQRRLRYIAARWAAWPNLLAWEWWNEVDLTWLGDPNLLRPWLREMTAALRLHDPYRHLATISYANTTDARVVSRPEIDLLQRHDYSLRDPVVAMPRAYAQMAELAPKPVLYGEYGRDSSGERFDAFDPDGVHFHTALWASTLSGYASAAMYWWWDGYIEPNQLWEHFNGLSRFLAGQDLAALGPITPSLNTTAAVALGRGDGQRALVWLRNSGYSVEAAIEAFRKLTLATGNPPKDWQYTLQTMRGATVTLDGLRPGRYRAEWLDPLSGVRMASRIMAVGGDGRLAVPAPAFERDVALRVTLLR